MSEPQASICRESTADEKQFEGATLWFDRRRLKMLYRHFCWAFFFFIFSQQPNIQAGLCGPAGFVWSRRSRLRLNEDEYASLRRCSATQLCTERKEGQAPSPQGEHVFNHKSRKARQAESYVLLHDNTEDLRQPIGINCNFLTFCGPSEAENTARAACAAHAFGEFKCFHEKTAPNSRLKLFLRWA